MGFWGFGGSRGLGPWEILQTTSLRASHRPWESLQTGLAQGARALGKPSKGQHPEAPRETQGPLILLTVGGPSRLGLDRWQKRASR